jgi:Coenzyme PQQ synthesis protein D (PqqD)
MSPPNEMKPKSLSRDQLVVEDLGAELMIYDQKRNRAFCLNQKAAFIWQRCDGKTTVGELAAKLAHSSGEAIDEKVVHFALQSLFQDGLLEPSSFEPVVPLGMTRRQVMQKIGVRAAIALPLVTTLMVATPKAHASGKSSSGGGKKHHN